MNDDRQPASALTRDEISAALAALSEKLGEKGAFGEICLFGGTETQYLVEGLFEEGKI